MSRSLAWRLLWLLGVSAVAACGAPAPSSVADRAFIGRDVVAELEAGQGREDRRRGNRLEACPSADQLLVETDIEIVDFAWRMADATQDPWMFRRLVEPLHAIGTMARIERELDASNRNGLSQTFGWNRRAAFWGATALAIVGDEPWFGGFTAEESFLEGLLSAYVSWLERGARSQLWTCYERALLSGQGGF